MKPQDIHPLFLDTVGDVQYEGALGVLIEHAIAHDYSAMIGDVPTGDPIADAVAIANDWANGDLADESAVVDAVAVLLDFGWMTDPHGRHDETCSLCRSVVVARIWLAEIVFGGVFA